MKITKELDKLVKKKAIKKWKQKDKVLVCSYFVDDSDEFITNMMKHIAKNFDVRRVQWFEYEGEIRIYI
jgi:hypothetical protein